MAPTQVRWAATAVMGLGLVSPLLEVLADSPRATPSQVLLLVTSYAAREWCGAAGDRCGIQPDRTQAQNASALVRTISAGATAAINYADLGEHSRILSQDAPYLIGRYAPCTSTAVEALSSLLVQTNA